MLTMNRFLSLLIACLLAAPAWADPPVASYIFPAGGQRGKTVPVKVGGLNLYRSCGAEILGPGVRISPKLTRAKTLWFEGPLLPLPDSQRAEDYPKDMAGEIQIQADAPPGLRHVRLWSAQGAMPHLKFIVGDLPELLEEEIDGDPIPVPVTLPVTINGRIFPRGDVDVWSFQAKKSQPVSLEVHALRLGTPLEARLEIRDTAGRRLAETDLPSISADVRLRFTPPADALYHVHIHDINHGGSQAHVYRLTLTQGRYADRLFPLGGKKGTTGVFEVTGQGWSGTVNVPLPVAIGPAWIPLAADSNALLVDVDELDEVTASAASDPATKPVAIRAPIVCNGHILKAGQIDSWSIAGKKGDTLEVELRAARLGSSLDGNLAITDGAGKEVLRSDTGPEGDPSLRFMFPADGVYVIRVQDRFRSRGGPEFAYRLRVAPPAPAFRLVFKTDGLALLRGGQIKLPLTVERLGGFQDAITLGIEGLPKGVTFTPAVIAAKQNALDITLKADADATVGPARLTLRGIAKIEGKEVLSTAQLAQPLGHPAIETFLVGVALPTPFKIKGEYDMRWASRGGTFERKYQIERLGYDGPIEVSLADRQARHLQGVTGPTILVPAGAAEFTYPVQLPPWMETGRTSRTCVMGVAKVKDKDGTEHEVGFTSIQQNEQLVAVVEPARLGLSLEKGSVSAAPETKIALPFKLARGLKLEGPVHVEAVLPAHFRGIRAEKVVLAADKEEGRLVLVFDRDLSAALNMPVTIRATIMEAGRPFTAEAKLELVRVEK